MLYLGLRILLFVSKRLSQVFTFHLVALPFHDRHTGDSAFDTLLKNVNVVYFNWKTKHLGVSSGGDEK